MLTETQAAVIARASEPGFDGIELLACPPGWPLSTSPAGSPSPSPVRLASRSRSSSNATLSFQPPKISTPPHIAVLDSSFNPPTLAHLALACSAFPPPIINPNVRRSRALSSPKSPAALIREAASYFSSHGVAADDHLAAPPEDVKDEIVHPDPSPGPYTARLLMYAARNADKTPGIADATSEQRAEMMLAQANAMPPQAGPVAVAIVAEPTFVAKAKALVRLLKETGAGAGAWSNGNGAGHDTLHEASPTSPASSSTPSTPSRRATASPHPHSSSDPPPAVTFLVGTDTLVRIFDGKYYPLGGMDAALEELFSMAWLVCARRGSGGDSTDVTDTRAQEDALLARADVARWVGRGRIRLIRAPESVADVSSTRVRSALRMGAGAGALRGLCADPVAKYLLEQRLYRGH